MTPSMNLEPVERKATASVIADVIRDRIIDGSFPPGTPLGEAQLAEQLDVSRGPVREALQRLLQEELLIARPHRGVFVTELDEHDIVDVYRARRAVERAAAEIVLEHEESAALDPLVRLVERMHDASQRGRWNTIVDLDRRFHEGLVAAAGSKRLSRMYRTLAAETAMCIAALEPAYTTRSDIVREHQSLLEALKAGNPASALACIDEHLDQALRHLVHTQFIVKH